MQPFFLAVWTRHQPAVHGGRRFTVNWVSAFRADHFFRQFFDSLRAVCRIQSRQLACGEEIKSGNFTHPATNFRYFACAAAEYILNVAGVCPGAGPDVSEVLGVCP